MMAVVRRRRIGPPLATAQAVHERLTKTVALAVFSGSVAKLGFGGKIRKSSLGKSMVCELQLSCFR